MVKYQVIWNAASQRPKSSEIINNILNRGLIYPRPTRWNSLHDSIAKLIKIKKKLNRFLNAINPAEKSFKDTVIECMEEFC